MTRSEPTPDVTSTILKDQSSSTAMRRETTQKVSSREREPSETERMTRAVVSEDQGSDIVAKREDSQVTTTIRTSTMLTRTTKLKSVCLVVLTKGDTKGTITELSVATADTRTTGARGPHLSSRDEDAGGFRDSDG